MQNLIPEFPHSSKGPITVYNDAFYATIPAVEFQPDNATALAAIQTLLYESCAVSSPHEGLKDVTANEETAAKEYLPKLWAYLQSMYSQSLIRKLLPVFVGRLGVATTYNIFPTDVWDNELNHVEYEPILTIPGLELLVREMNPMITLAYPHPSQELPGAYMIPYGPNMTAAEALAARDYLMDRVELFRNWAGKVKLPTAKLSVKSFVARESPSILPFDFKDYRWRFWAATYMFIMKTAGADTYMRPTVSGAQYDPTAAATWHATSGYLLKEGDTPSALHAIRKMFEIPHANNPIGCIVAGDANTVGTTDALAANDFYLAITAKQDIAGTLDTVPSFVGLSSCGIYRNFALFAYKNNTTNTGIKLSGGQPINDAFAQSTGGYRYIEYNTNVWNTGLTLERAFFSQLFKGKMTQGSRAEAKASVKVVE